MAAEQQFADELCKVISKQLGQDVIVHALYEEEPVGTPWDQSGFPRVTGIIELNETELSFALDNFHLPCRTGLAADIVFLDFSWNMARDLREKVKVQ